MSENEYSIINQLYFSKNKRIKVIDGIKAANQLTWRWEVILDCSAGSVSPQKSFRWRRGRRECSKDALGKSHLAIASFEDGREPGAKECC